MIADRWKRSPTPATRPAGSDCPASQVDWAGLDIAPAPWATPWPGNGPTIAGVSSYGLSCTFVHTLVGVPPHCADALQQARKTVCTIFRQLDTTPIQP